MVRTICLLGASAVLLGSSPAAAQARKSCPPSDPLCGQEGANKNQYEFSDEALDGALAKPQGAALAARGGEGAPRPAVSPFPVLAMPPPRPDGPRPTAPGAVPPIDYAKNPPPKAPPLDDPAPPFRVFYRELVAARINPLGLLSDARLSARAQLFKPDNVFTAENFVGLGSTFSITPAWARGGPFVEIQPLSILSFAGGLEAWGFFKSFGQLQSFPDANSPYDDGTLKALSSPPAPQQGTNYSSHGQIAWLEGRLQLKLFTLAVRSTTTARYTDLALRNGDAVFYDQILDVLAPDKGWVVNHDTDVLYFATDNWIIGARYSFVHTFLPDPAGGASAAPQAGDEPFRRKSETNRLGPIIAYRFFDKPWAAFNQPTVNLLVQWWLDHPYRTGDGQCGLGTDCVARNGKILDSSRVTQGFPLIALAFSFSGDLIPPKR